MQEKYRDAREVAGYIVNYYIDHNKYITLKKLHYLLYFIEVYYYKIYQNRFLQDSFYRWPYNRIIIPLVQDRYCHWGTDTILLRTEDKMDKVALICYRLNNADRKFLNTFIEATFNIDEKSLFKQINQYGSPFNELNRKDYAYIPFEKIHNYNCFIPNLSVKEFKKLLDYKEDIDTKTALRPKAKTLFLYLKESICGVG